MSLFDTMSELVRHKIKPVSEKLDIIRQGLVSKKFKFVSNKQTQVCV